MPFQGFNLFRLQGDLLWAGAELAARLFNDPVLSLLAPKGDGKTPVMTFPGFSAAESSLDLLNSFLQQCGYIAASWGIGPNKGLRDMEQLDRVANKLVDRLHALTDRHGRPAALVGQSLGGIFARELARRSPQEVDRVITLGTPTILDKMPADMMEATAHILSGFHEQMFGKGKRKGFDLSEPPPGVAVISIYSPCDGVVDPEAARIREDYLSENSPAIRENLQLVCSHYGMAMNPLVLLAIADRLAQNKEEWVPFDPLHYAGFR